MPLPKRGSRQTASTPAASPSPKPRNAERTRKRIVDVAESEFACRGFSGARLKAIADAAGVRPALIHHYFDDKRGLYSAVLDRALEPTSAHSWLLIETHKSLANLVEGFVEMLVAFQASHPNLLAILRHEAVSGSAALTEIFQKQTLPVVKALICLLEARQHSGEVRSDVSATDMLLGAMSIVMFPFSEAAVVDALFPTLSAAGPSALAARKAALSNMILAAVRADSGAVRNKDNAAKSSRSTAASR